MIYQYCTDENYLGKVMPFTFEITKPVKMRVRQEDGTEVLIGYGIGDRVEILERESVCAVAHRPILKSEIPLTDGGTIVEFPVEDFCRRLRD
jgi:hypothetical protein